MNREEYLSELYGRLRQSTPPNELDHIMKYYEEYFDEVGEKGEQDVIAELGSPEDLACQIMSGRSASPQPQYRYEQPVPRRWTAGKIVAVVLLSPLWISLIAVVVTLIVGLVGGLGFGGLGVIAGGIFSAWCGFTALFTPGFPTTMFFGGMGLCLVAVGLFLVVAALALGRVLGKAVGSFCRWLFVGRKAGVAQ